MSRNKDIEKMQLKKGIDVISDPDLVTALRRTYSAARTYMGNEVDRLHAEALRKSRRNHAVEVPEPDFKIMPCSMPDVISLLSSSPYDSENWHRPYSTISEEVVGNIRFGRKEVPAVIIIHGGGVLSGIDAIKRKNMDQDLMDDVNLGSFDGFAISPQELNELLKGKTRGSNGMRFYSLDEFLSQGKVDEKRYAIVMTLKEAKMPLNPGSDALIENLVYVQNHPLFIARAGSHEKAEELIKQVIGFYTQKEFRPEDIKYGNVSALERVNPDVPQVRFLHMSKMNGYPGLWDFAYAAKGHNPEYNLFTAKYPAAAVHSQTSEDIIAVFEKALFQQPKAAAQPAYELNTPHVQQPASQASEQSYVSGRGFMENLGPTAEASQARVRGPRHPRQITERIRHSELSIIAPNIDPVALGNHLMEQMSTPYAHNKKK